MQGNNELKEIYIKTFTCYYFDYLGNILLDKKSY